MLRRLLPLLLLAALLVPRGARLVWCLCLEPPGSACCAGRCCPPEPGDGAGAEHEADCCLALQVEDFDEFLSGNAPELPALVLLAALQSAPALLASQPPVPIPACKGPPPPLRPAGLLAGVRPLRI